MSSSICEQLLSQIDAKLTSLDAKVSSLDAKLTSLDIKVSSLDAKVSSLDAKLTAWKLLPRLTSSSRALNQQDSLTILQTRETIPTTSFSTWVGHEVQAMTMETLVPDQRFEDLVFSLLERVYEKDLSPIFCIKRHKTNWIYEGGDWRSMQESDMKRMILMFQCQATYVVDQWKFEMDQRWERWADSDSDDDTERHFQERRYQHHLDKINRLCLERGNTALLRTLLRKFNTYMLRAQGVAFLTRS